MGGIYRVLDAGFESAALCGEQKSGVAGVSIGCSDAPPQVLGMLAKWQKYIVRVNRTGMPQASSSPCTSLFWVCERFLTWFRQACLEWYLCYLFTQLLVLRRKWVLLYMSPFF